MEDIAAPWTPRQRAFFETCLLGKTAAARPTFSRANAWKVRLWLEEEIGDLLRDQPRESEREKPSRPNAVQGEQLESASIPLSN